MEAASRGCGSTRARATLDVGTGSGAIAVTLALEARLRRLRVRYFRRRAGGGGTQSRTAPGRASRFSRAICVDAVAPQSIDLLISNPPYVPGADAANMQTEVRDWEPHVALFAGDTGLEIYRRLIARSTRWC